MRLEDYYNYPRDLRSCLNCVHLDQPPGQIAGIEIGGCRQKFAKYSITTNEELRKQYCGRWFLKRLTENDI